jgi:hypothetical protein
MFSYLKYYFEYFIYLKLRFLYSVISPHLRLLNNIKMTCYFQPASLPSDAL